MTDDLQPAEIAFAEAFDYTPTDADLLASYARTYWPSLVRGADTTEAIGRALIRAASCGPVHWSGIRILRDLGLLVEGSQRPQ